MLAAFTTNAALTYLCSMSDGLFDSFKYTLVAGAVTGGGMTIIANAQNSALIAVLRSYFDDEAVHTLELLLVAFPLAIIAALAFRLL